MKTYLTNEDKVRRAKDILDLLARGAKDQDEADLKTRWMALIEGVKEENLLQFVYEKMGGLVRTEIEQKAHEEKVEKIKKSKKIDRDK